MTETTLNLTDSDTQNEIALAERTIRSGARSPLIVSPNDQLLREVAAQRADESRIAHIELERGRLLESVERGVLSEAEAEQIRDTLNNQYSEIQTNAENRIAHYVAEQEEASRQECVRERAQWIERYDLPGCEIVDFPKRDEA